MEAAEIFVTAMGCVFTETFVPSLPAATVEGLPLMMYEPPV